MDLRGLQGLTSEKAAESQNKNGPNIIEEAPPAAFWELFKETFTDPMIKLLCVIAVVMAVMAALGYASFYEPVGIVAAILIVAFFNAKTSATSDKEYRKLKEQTSREDCTVLRGREVKVIDVS